MTEIDSIENYYGKLTIMEQNGKYYWGIGDHYLRGIKWNEIPDYLYNALTKFINLEQ